MFALGIQQQSGFDFPQQLSEKYRPLTIDGFIGLDKPKAICRKLAANPRPMSLLFIGPSGVGKTTLAMALAAAMPAEIHHIPSQDCNLETIERVVRSCHYVPMAGYRMHMVLIDEFDQTTNAAQIALLSKLDSTAMPPNTIFVATCNATDRLQDRLLSRFHSVAFASHGISKDATALLEGIWDAEAPAGAKRPNCATIVKEACNNIRESLMRLETELLAA